MTAAPVAMTAAVTQASKNVRMFAIPFMSPSRNYQRGLVVIKRQIVELQHIVTEPCRSYYDRKQQAPPKIKPEG